MMDYVQAIGVVLLTLAVVGVAGYFAFRWAFQRAADRVADRLGRVLGDLAGAPPGGAGPGRPRPTASRAATGRTTPMGAYAAAEGLSEEAARREFRESIERTARLMDAAVVVPGLGPVGFDALLGLLPVGGDVISAAISVSLVARSLKYGVPPEVIARMLGNVLIDMLIGAVPLAGDLADIWFRANLRNVAILRQYLDEQAGDTIEARPTRVE